MNVVYYERVCYELVCCEHGLFRMVCYEQVCFDREPFELNMYFLRIFIQFYTSNNSPSL